MKKKKKTGLIKCITHGDHYRQTLLQVHRYRLLHSMKNYFEEGQHACIKTAATIYCFIIFQVQMQQLYFQFVFLRRISRANTLHKEKTIWQNMFFSIVKCINAIIKISLKEYESLSLEGSCLSFTFKMQSQALLYSLKLNQKEFILCCLLSEA